MPTLIQTKTSTHVLGEHNVISPLCYVNVSIQFKFNYQNLGAMTLKLGVQFLLQEGVGESLGDQLSFLTLSIYRYIPVLSYCYLQHYSFKALHFPSSGQN